MVFVNNLFNFKVYIVICVEKIFFNSNKKVIGVCVKIGLVLYILFVSKEVIIFVGVFYLF